MICPPVNLPIADMPEDKMLLRPLNCAHAWISAVVRKGDCVLDGTAGNGHDTLFLAQAVGEAGKVYAFDIQPEAIVATRERLAREGVLERVVLHTGNHAELDLHVPHGLSAAMFNLGYLPGGNKAHMTMVCDTIPALEKAFSLLNRGGILTVMCYPGHDGGKEEALAVDDFCARLPIREAFVCRLQSWNGAADAPRLIGIQKR